MKITRKYLLAEMTGPYLIGLASFTLVVLLNRFSRLSDLVIARGVPMRMVGRLLFSLFPPFFEITLPASLLLAVLLALGRLAADSEMTALAASGVGMRGVAYPVLIAGGITFAGGMLVAWQGIPWGYWETQRALAAIVSERAGAGATEHVFREIAPDVLVYPDHVSADGQRMAGVFLSFRAAGEEPLLVFAREGHFTPSGVHGAVSVTLDNGAIHSEPTGKRVYRIASFGKMVFRIPLEVPVTLGSDDPKGMTLPQLSRKAAEMEGTGRGGTYRYHFHRRLSLAVSSLCFSLLAIPLGMAQRSRGKSSAFGITVAIIVVYYLFVAVAGAMENRAPRAMVAFLWAPNVLGLLLAAWIFRQSERSLAPFTGILERLRVSR